MANVVQQNFINSAVGKSFDPDNMYGLQCKDLIDAYVVAIFNKPWSETIRPGDANICFNNSNGAYFDKILNDPSNANLIPQYGDIITWGGNSVNQFGHIAVVVDADANGVNVIQQDGFAQTPTTKGRLAYDNYGTGPVQGWLRPKANMMVGNQPAPVAKMEPNWRKNGNAPARLRSSPIISDDNIIGEIPANRVDSFGGYIIGEEVDIKGGKKSNIWYVDNGDDGKGARRYAAAAVFTEIKITSLINISPKPNERLIGSAGGQMRDAPNPNAKWVRGIDPGTIEAFTAWVRGEKVTVSGITTDIWFKDSTGYVWAGVFIDPSTNGLSEYKMPAVPAPKPVPVVPEYSFKKDLSCVTEVIPAGPGNYEVGNFPAVPNKIYIHQFMAGEKRFDTHIGSVTGEFKTPNVQKSSQLVIEGKKINQMVKFGDRAYHAGPDGNNDLGFETYGGQDEETLNSLALAIYETELFYNKTMILDVHKSVMQTQCGDQVNLKDIRARVDKLHKPKAEPEVKPVDPKPPVGEDKEQDDWDEFVSYMKKWFKSRKK